MFGVSRAAGNWWRAGAAHCAPWSTEFAGQGLGFAEPTFCNRRRRVGSGPAPAAAIWCIHLAYVPYAREPPQREL